MKQESNKPGTVARLLWIISLCLISAPLALAAPGAATLGELLVARGVSVDDSLATPGLTLLQGSRIKTDAEGGAILNLGRLGRVTLGPEAEIVLESSDRALSGQLISGWMIVSAPKGVEVAIKTADGVATSDGAESATLRVDMSQGSTRLESAGTAILHAGAVSQRVSGNEEIELSRPVAAGTPPVFSRYTLEASLASVAANAHSRAAVAASYGGTLSTSLRAAVQSVTLDETLAAPVGASSSGLRPVVGDTRVVSVASQEITCGFFNENCINCQIYPQLIKAKAGCTLSFIARFENVFAHSRVTIRPFMNNACFRIFPGYPQVVLIPPGGASVFQINANNCTVAQTRSAANALVVVETNTCGTKYVQVEWATPCR